MSNIMQDLRTIGLNPFAVTLLAESLLKSPLAPMTVGKPQGFFFPVQRSDCAGWAGVRITVEAIPDDAAADRNEVVSRPAALTSRGAPPAAVPPEGWSVVYVKNIGPLMDALDRAQRKGYLPDAMADEWEAFGWMLPTDASDPVAKDAEQCGHEACECRGYCKLASEDLKELASEALKSAATAAEAAARGFHEGRPGRTAREDREALFAAIDAIASENVPVPAIPPLGEHSPITLAIRAINLLKTYAEDLRNHPADVRVVALAEQALARVDEAGP